MRLTFLALVSCLGCDSGAAKVAAPTTPSAPAAAPPTAPPPPSPEPAPAANPTPAAAPVTAAPTAAGAAAQPEAAASDARTEGQPDCRFQRLAPWVGGHLTWQGSCRKGFADGSGVIICTLEGAEPDRFYGRLEAGSPSLGVLQSEGGYMAGRWANGALAEPLPDDLAQRNVLIDAFNAGAAAATAVSKSLAQQDAKSSALYAKQARSLREQMD